MLRLPPALTTIPPEQAAIGNVVSLCTGSAHCRSNGASRGVTGSADQPFRNKDQRPEGKWGNRKGQLEESRQGRFPNMAMERKGESLV